MSQIVDAVYENGLLRPLGPLRLDEHERVKLTVADCRGPLSEIEDGDFLRYCEQEADQGVTLEAVRQALSKISGSMADVVTAERGEY